MRVFIGYKKMFIEVQQIRLMNEVGWVKYNAESGDCVKLESVYIF